MTVTFVVDHIGTVYTYGSLVFTDGHTVGLVLRHADATALAAELDTTWAESLFRDRDAAIAHAERLKHALERAVETGTTLRQQRDQAEAIATAARAVRELWRHDAMAAAEPEIHALVALIDATPPPVAS